MLSLVLDEHREDASCSSCHFNPMERQKLLRAKDLLLADLTQAPGVTELARESGLSVLKIKRDFVFCSTTASMVFFRLNACRRQEDGWPMAILPL